jgi:hypothetical protein
VWVYCALASYQCCADESDNANTAVIDLPHHDKRSVAAIALHANTLASSSWGLDWLARSRLIRLSRAPTHFTHDCTKLLGDLVLENTLGHDKTRQKTRHHFEVVCDTCAISVWFQRHQRFDS